ncbi:MAG TPA: hypothetical protein VII01_16585 [Solirubrobacteraceae bacterium]|jgi:hypothetical protein
MCDHAAAIEVGASPATLRSWRRRAKQASHAKPAATPRGTPDGLSPDDLHRRAADARRSESLATAKVDRLLAQGLANDARAASAVAKDSGVRASSLEADARLAKESEGRVRESEARLSDGQVWVHNKVVRLFLTSLGLGWTDAHDDLADAVLDAVCNAERVEGSDQATVTIPPAEAERARAEVEAVWSKAAEEAALAEREAAEPDRCTDGARYETCLHGLPGSDRPRGRWGS